jgi:hypothetical protein
MTEGVRKMQYLESSIGSWTASGQTNQGEPITVELNIDPNTTTITKTVTTANGVVRETDSFDTNDGWWLDDTSSI